MLKITIEFLPYGIEENKKIIGTGIIVNDGSGTVETGNYRAAIAKEPLKKWWKHCHYSGWPRTKKTAWELLHVILREMFGETGG